MPKNNVDKENKQTTILKLLLDKPHLQKELQEKLNISSPGLLYHLNILEKNQFIKKRTLHQIGFAKINEISINPLQLQQIRSTLGMKCGVWTLFTGFGEYKTGYRIPDKSYKLLQNKHFKIDRVVCITTKSALEKRKSKEKEEGLIKIDKYYIDHDYHEMRNPESEFFIALDSILSKELEKSDIILDITPLTKLYSLEMLKKSNKFKLACFYLGEDENGNDKLVWMSDLEVKGVVK